MTYEPGQWARVFGVVLIAWLMTAANAQAQNDPLPSWNNTASKQAILAFVDRVSRPGSVDFVPVEERIAVFDNDGTLWGEQPMYVQLAFAIDRVRALSEQHPDWVTQEPFASLLKGDVKGALAGGEAAIAKIVMATHAGVSTGEFARIVADWIASARHPGTQRLYTGMVYQPMIELLAYLRAQGFKTWIVSGGGIEFMRPWAERIYGIPPEQVIGSRIKTQFVRRDGSSELMRLPEIDMVDDQAGKPVGINAAIGRRPIAAFGNSDGDLEMMQWTADGVGPRFCLYVHHDDSSREWAYDRESQVGRLDRGLDAAQAGGWTVVSMKNDWKRIYPERPPTAP